MKDLLQLNLTNSILIILKEKNTTAYDCYLKIEIVRQGRAGQMLVLILTPTYYINVFFLENLFYKSNIKLTFVQSLRSLFPLCQNVCI